MKHLNLKFRVHNEQHSEAIQKRLFEMGYGWSMMDTKEIGYTNMPYIYVENCIVCGRKGRNEYFEEHKGKESTLDDLYKMSKQNSLKLNDEYTAEIYDDKVVVGCQEFTHKSIKKLYKKLKEL